MAPNDPKPTSAASSSMPPVEPTPAEPTPVEAATPLAPTEPYTTTAVEASPLAAAKAHVERALASIRAGTRTRLHLNPEEHAALEEHVKSLPEDQEETVLVKRLLAGEEVAGTPQTA
jgi:hypothetical protein